MHQNYLKLTKTELSKLRTSLYTMDKLSSNTVYTSWLSCNVKK